MEILTAVFFAHSIFAVAHFFSILSVLAMHTSAYLKTSFQSIYFFTFTTYHALFQSFTSSHFKSFLVSYTTIHISKENNNVHKNSVCDDYGLKRSENDNLTFGWNPLELVSINNNAFAKSFYLLSVWNAFKWRSDFYYSYLNMTCERLTFVIHDIRKCF